MEQLRVDINCIKSLFLLALREIQWFLLIQGACQLPNLLVKTWMTLGSGINGYHPGCKKPAWYIIDIKECKEKTAYCSILNYQYQFGRYQPSISRYSFLGFPNLERFFLEKDHFLDWVNLLLRTPPQKKKKHHGPWQSHFFRKIFCLPN